MCLLNCLLAISKISSIRIIVKFAISELNGWLVSSTRSQKIRFRTSHVNLSNISFLHITTYLSSDMFCVQLDELHISFGLQDPELSNLEIQAYTFLSFLLEQCQLFEQNRINPTTVFRSLPHFLVSASGSPIYCFRK